MRKQIELASAVMFLVFIFGFAAAFWIVPDADFSDEENRSLGRFPAFSVESLMDGSFSDGINTYFADQFPIRDLFVGIKGITETVGLKGENNGVLIGKNGQIAVRLFTMYKSRLERTDDMDYYYRDNVAMSVDALNAYAEKETRPLVTLLPPRAVDTAASALSYPTEISDELHEQLITTVSDKAGWIDLLPMLRERYEKGEYVCYRTDHHWTTRGAYLAYCEVMKAFGMEGDIIPEDAFTVETVEDFYGTSWSKAGCKYIPADTMELWSLGNDDSFETTCYASKMIKGTDGKPVEGKEAYKSFSGWLERSHLDGKDKYAAFLDGTHNELTVFSKEEKRERLLLAKDSFANSMVPFLIQHFDLVIVNMSNKMTELSEYAEEYDCSRVLIVYNLENLLTGNNLASIR